MQIEGWVVPIQMNIFPFGISSQAQSSPGCMATLNTIALPVISSLFPGGVLGNGHDSRRWSSSKVVTDQGSCPLSCLIWGTGLDQRDQSQPEHHSHGDGPG